MAKYYKNLTGNCPYCQGSMFSETQNRKEGQTLMKCSSCNKWSMRVTAGVQYPLYDPTDETSLPGTVSGD